MRSSESGAKPIDAAPPACPGAESPTLPAALSPLRVAIVHYWFVNRRGGERTVEVLADMFPQADIFTLFMDMNSLGKSIRTHKITTSPLQKFPGVIRHYPKLLPLFPWGLEQFDLDAYDLVISSESGPAKGILTRPGTCHICYCHTPLRYVWRMYHHYRSSAPGGALGRAIFSWIAHYVRQWDYSAAARVDYFVASSANGKARINKYYRREADIVFPPVDTTAFSNSSRPGDYYLVVSPLVSYKRIDLAIAACNHLQRRLVVVGEGEESAALEKLAGPTVEFLGFQPDEVVREHYGRCRALLFPGEEDVGLTPIEAQASGRPVIAFGGGGALETVKGIYPGGAGVPESSTGVFFAEQTVDSLVAAMRFFESVEAGFSPQIIRAQARQFDAACFRTNMYRLILEKLEQFRRMPAAFRLAAP